MSEVKKYPLVFLDTETTSLRPDRECWEIAMIRREKSGIENTVKLMIDVTLQNADPISLDIGKFWERHPEGQYRKQGHGKGHTTTKREASAMIFAMTFGAQIVGAVPSFDTRGIENLFAFSGNIPMWHHRLICVESMTVGYLSKEVGGLGNCAAALGIEQDPATEHTAMGDADLTMRIYDAIIGDRGISNVKY